MNDSLDRHRIYLKYLLLLSFITFAILFVATAAHGAWYNANWQYRKQITIQGARVSGGAHSGFPVLIKLASDTDLAADAQNDGDDILFTSSNETSKIPHEIESFNGTTGELVAWVKVDLNAYQNDTTIYMYYGYGSATNQENATGVWDNNYVGVWHLNETVTDEQTTGTHNNSASASYTGSQNGNASANGKIAGGQNFDGNDDEIRFSSAIIGDRTAYTITAWMQTSSDDQGIYSESSSSTDKYLMIRKDNYKLDFYLDYSQYPNFSGGTLGSNFHHVAVVQTSKSSRASFVDGGSKTSNSASVGTISFTTSSIGLVRALSWPTCCEFSGIIDEVRISSVARSDDWIKTSYNNQVWPNTAVTPSPLPSPNPGGGFITVYGETTSGGGNSPPSVNAGADDSVTLPDVYNLDGTADSGGDGPTTPPTVTWTEQSGPGTVTFGDANLQDTTAAFSTEGTYVLRLTADDGADTAYDEVTITVSTNSPPSVNAGADDSVTLPDVYNLDGTADSGGDGPTTPPTVTWTTQSGPGTVTFGDANLQDTTAAFSIDGTYVLRLTADDGADTAYDEVTITVYPDGGGGGGNTPPNVDAGTDGNVTLPDVYNLDGTADDGGDGPSLTVTWTKQSGPGTVTFGDANAQDTTAVFSTDGTYVLRLTADDGTDTDYAEVTITVYASGGTPPPVGDYSCNLKITILGSQVQGGPHDDFPVLISLTDDSLKNTGCGVVTDSSGYDILFTDASKTTQLDHEIEKYDGGTGEIIAWVRVDLSVSPNNTVIYMYYGNSSAGDQQNPTGVWDSNYVAVWHLEEISGTHADSTSNNNTGTPYGGVNQNGTGQIDGADVFDGSSDRVEAPDYDILNAITISAWINWDGDTSNTGGIVSKRTSSEVLGDWDLRFYDDGRLEWMLWSGTDSSQKLFSNSAISDGVLKYVVVTLDESTNTAKMYIDGGLSSSDTNFTNNLADTPQPINIGWGGQSSQYYGGTIDELRLSKVARSGDWINTEYNNQSDPSSFYNVEKHCASPAPPIGEFTCSIPITIDSSKVSGTSDLTDFPMLISLTNIGLRTTSGCGYVQSSEGYDIIFSDATQTTVLDHEIEEYDSTSGKLVAWVRIPTLYATADTTIYLHFGHSGTTCGATENPTAVWDSNYQGVWHLNEASGTRYDSTSNGNELSDINTVSSSTGKIGVGADFESTNSERLQRTDPGTGDILDMTASITFTAWVNSESTESPQTILGKWREPPCTSDDPPYQLRIGDDGAGNQRLAWLVASDCTTGDTLNGTYGNLTVGSWYHVAVIYDDSAEELLQYVNGSLVAGPLSYTSGGPYDSGGNFQLGARASGQELDGMLDEARISNSVRSADWIKTSYNNQSDPSSFYSVGASSCFLGGFSCDRKITIDSSKVAGTSDLTNFPVLIRIQNDCNIKTAANGGSVQDSNGWDIMFTDSDGVTQLDHEIEAYDGTTGDLTAWVRVPTLPYNSDKDIYMYYGKSDLTCDPSNPNGVWDSDYVGVWHLKESSGSGSYVKNSKQDAYHGNPSGSNFIASAKIAGGRQVDQPVEFDNGGDLLDGDTAFTLSFWGYPNYASDAEWQAAEEHMFNADSIWGLRWGQDGWIQADVKLTSGTNYFNDWDTLPRAQWHHLVLNYDGSALRWYKNGDMVQESTGYTGQALISNSIACLGYCWGGGGVSYIDEFRYSRSARSAGWIQTEYNNQNDPDSFYSMGQDSCGGSYGFNFQYCKKITVDHTQVDSDLTDFPLLVNLTNDDDLKTVANGGRIENSQGYDIVFRSPGCENLDHEVEKYDGSTGDLVSWVRVPTLSSSVDTEIYLYYGANVTCSTENPGAVWDSNYKGVWHMKDLGTPGTGDSTSYSNDGTKKAVGEPLEVDENIGKSQDFGNDGTVNDYINISSVANDVDVNKGTYELWLRREFADSGGGGGGCGSVAIDGSADYGTVDNGSSITISHTTSGSDRLMLVGVSLVNDGNEYVDGVTYNGTALTKVGSRYNSDDARIEIWKLVAPDIGTHDVVITFNETLNTQAVGGVMTFTCVDQSTPLGTFASAENDGSLASVDVSSATGELVFGVVAAETPQGFTEGAGQTEHWYEVLGSGRTEGAGSTEAGAATVTTSWTLGHSDHWAIGGVSIKPVAGGGASPTMSIMRVDTDAENRITFTYDQDIEKFRFRHEAGNTDIKVERASSEIPLNTWTHAAMTWDKNVGEFKAYINGSQVGSTLTGLGTWVGSATYGNLGRKYDDTQYYEGSLDEARISDVARSADWIQTQYINQSDPGNFYTVGSCFEQTTEVTEGWEEAVQ